MRTISTIEIPNNKYFIAPVLDYFDTILRGHAKLDFSRYNKTRYVLGTILEQRMEKAYPKRDGKFVIDFLLSSTHYLK